MPQNPYAYERDEKVNAKPEQLRQGLRDSWRFIAHANQPEELRNMFDLDDPGAQRAANRRRLRTDNSGHAFVDEVERVWLSNRGQVPLSWLAAQDPADVALLTPDIAQSVFQLQEDAAWKREHDEQIRVEAQRRYDSANRRRAFQNFLRAIPTQGSQITASLFGDDDQQSLMEYEQQVRDELSGAGADLRAEGNWVQTVLGGVGWVISNGLELGMRLSSPAGTGDLVTEGLHNAGVIPFNPYRAEFEAEQQKAIAELEAEQGLPDEALMDRLRPMVTEQAWQQLQTESPQQYNTYLQMSNGDPFLAFGFFSADLNELPEVQDQLRQIVNDPEGGYRADLDEFVQTLDEQQFTLSANVLEAMATYGKYPMRLASALTLLLTDDDVRSDVLDGRWENMHEEIAKAKDTPAGVLGIENTAVGLALDVGAGIAFDPTTWLFGPRLTNVASRASTIDDALRMARGPLVRRTIDDAVTIALSDAKGNMPLVHTLSFLDEVGELPAAMEALQAVPQTLPARPWLNSQRALYAQETALDTVAKVLDPEDVARIGRFSDETLDNLATSVRNSGFSEPIELTYSLRDRTLHVTDGLKRVAVAQRMGLRGVPVSVRITDTLKRIVGQGRLLDPSDATTQVAAQIADTPQLFAFHGTTRVADDVVEAMLQGADDFTRGGLTQEAERALTYAQSTRPTVSKWGKAGEQAMAGREGWVLVFRRTDLPEAAQRALAAGRDVEELFPGGQATAPLRPVFAFRASEDLSEIASVARQAIDSGTPMHVGGTIEVGPAGVAADSLLEAGESIVNHPTSLTPDTPTLVRPDRLLPKRVVLGTDAVRARDELQKIIERAVANGATPPSATRLATGMAWTNRLRKLLRTLPGTDWITRYMSPQHMISRFELHGPQSASKIIETATRLWGDDTAKAELWVNRVLDYQRRLAQANSQYVDDLSRLRPLKEELLALEDLKGGGWDDSIRFLEDQLPTNPNMIDQWTQAKANRAQLQEEYVTRLRTVERQLGELDARYGQITDTAELAKLVEDMWDDFNRTRIATRKEWAELVDPETGIVPWEELRKGRTPIVGEHEGARKFLPEELRDQVRELGVSNPEKLVGNLSTVLNTRMAVNVPLTPLEMIVASEWGGAKYIRFSQRAFGHQVRETAWGLHKWWVIDKVFKPATAMTVSFDELMRIFHIGGADALMKWVYDRAAFTSARASALLRHGRLSVRRGAQHLPRRAQERIRVLSEGPTIYKQAERQVFEGIGLGWDDIKPGDAIYPDAARRWTGDLLQDSGFRAFLRGRDAFREWFTGPDGLRARQQVTLNKGVTGLLGSSDDLFDGWTTIFDNVILKPSRKSGKYADMRRAWEETAQLIESEGGRVHELPAWVFNHMGPVRGVRKQMGNRTPVSALTESFFEHLFMNPVNYRRGFLAELVRKTERERLVKLFTSQGRRIVPDNELEQLLGLRGIYGSRAGLKPYLQDLASRNGMVLESYIDDLADSRALTEIDNTLYTWDQGSRFGQQARAVFPFGRPWADMAAFWGREVLTRPALRGWINNRNFLNAGTIANGAVDRLMLNPKPLAMMSRLAATDFTVDEFAPGVGLPFNAEEASFNPLIFLPTGGENPFGSILPGLGFIPIVFMDLVIENMYDPVDDPEAYQELVSNIAQFIPSAEYNRGGLLGDILGGGTVGSGISLLTDLTGGLMGVPFYNFTSEMGDISREIDRTRQLSALMADEEELNTILSLQDPEAIDLYLRGLATQADRNASMSHASRVLTRLAVPVRAEYDTGLDEIQNVWLEASRRFPDDLRTRFRINENSSEEQVRSASNDIRSMFFDLPQWKRDLYIAQYPALAVNLVGSWEWTATAQSVLGTEAQTAYRTDGTREGLLRHQALIEAGYVRPIQPLSRAHRILGLIQASKESAAKQIYEFTAESVNNFIWDSGVTPEIKAAMDQVAASEFGQRLGYENGREVWEDWNSIELDFERFVAEQSGIAEGSEEFEALRDSVRLPTQLKPWGSSWPGLDDDELSARFSELQLFQFPTEVQALANGLGIDLTPGMTGLQLFQGVQDVLTQVDSPVWSIVRGPYQSYVDQRSAPAAAADFSLASQANNPDLDEDWRRNLTDFIAFEANLSERVRDRNGGVTLSEQEAVAQRYSVLMQTTDLPLDWRGIWKTRFERTYGPLDWEPPQPAAPTLADGSENPNAYAPYIQHVVDGDTLVVSEALGAARLIGGVDAGARPKMHEVRLLGVRAAEMHEPAGQTDKEALQDALMEALRNGDRIWLVRDPDTFGTNTDQYGRELAWLWIGDTPYYSEDDFRRND
jgi:endonuclease YncB( thermonuclease family)